MAPPQVITPAGDVAWARRHVLKETEVNSAVEGDMKKAGEYKLWCAGHHPESNWFCQFSASQGADNTPCCDA